MPSVDCDLISINDLTSLQVQTLASPVGGRGNRTPSVEKSGHLSCSDNFVFGFILVEVTFVCKEYVIDGKETAYILTQIISC